MRKLNERIAEAIASVFGSMVVFWAVLTGLVSWLALQTVLRGFDPYPFAFLLLLTNLVQFISVFVLQNTQNRQSRRLVAILKHLEAKEEQVERKQERVLADEEALLAKLTAVST